MAEYTLRNAWEKAERRFTLLQQHLDPMTQRRMSSIGVKQGWQCLEVAGGGGSVARWLCKQSGPTGHVVGTDIDTRFLEKIREPNFTALKHDITVEDLPSARFDFVHTRWLLHHLRDPERAIERMVAALRPGGWLLIEDVDFFPVHTSNSQLYVDFMVALTGTVVAPSGRDCFWARALPTLVATQGLASIHAEGDFGVLNGGGPLAEIFQLSAEQLRDSIIGSGRLTAERFDAALALLSDRNFWAFADGGIAVWGQRPAEA
jgi:SAM-dependent methyltransferase